MSPQPGEEFGGAGGAQPRGRSWPADSPCGCLAGLADPASRRRKNCSAVSPAPAAPTTAPAKKPFRNRRESLRREAKLFAAMTPGRGHFVSAPHAHAGLRGQNDPIAGSGTRRARAVPSRLPEAFAAEGLVRPLASIWAGAPTSLHPGSWPVDGWVKSVLAWQFNGVRILSSEEIAFSVI